MLKTFNQHESNGARVSIMNKNSTNSKSRRSRSRRQNNSAGAKKGATKYTLIELVDNINTDVKSEVADFDFKSADKDQVVVYYENKIA